MAQVSNFSSHLINDSDCLTIYLFSCCSNWLFGEKESLTVVADGKDNRIRGWFPRPCAIPVNSEKDKDLDNYFETDSDVQYLIPNVSPSSVSTQTELNYGHPVQKVYAPVVSKKKNK